MCRLYIITYFWKTKATCMQTYAHMIGANHWTWPVTAGCALGRPGHCLLLPGCNSASDRSHVISRGFTWHGLGAKEVAPNSEWCKNRGSTCVYIIVCTYLSIYLSVCRFIDICLQACMYACVSTYASHLLHRDWNQLEPWIQVPFLHWMIPKVVNISGQ